MAEGVDTIARHTFTKERQLQSMSELSYRQRNQPSQQVHAPTYPQPTRSQGRGTPGRRTSRSETRSEHSRTSLQDLSRCREAATIPARSVPQLHRLQEDILQNQACRRVARPQKLQHRERTGSGLQGTIQEWRQCSPLAQSDLSLIHI